MINMGIKILLGFGSWILGAVGLSNLIGAFLLLFAPQKIDSNDLKRLFKLASGRISASTVAGKIVAGCWLVVLGVWLGFKAFSP